MSQINYDIKTASDGTLTLNLEGSLNSQTTGQIWSQCVNAVQSRKVHKVIVDTAQLNYCDGAGIGLLYQLRETTQARNAEIEFRNINDDYAQQLNYYRSGEFKEHLAEKPTTPGMVEEVGMVTVELWQEMRILIAFVGQLTVTMIDAIVRPVGVRWKDTIRIVESAGVDALPIVALVSFLIGLVMAFQAAIPLQMFGAGIFVADLVSISMLRELGPLMTAIMLAGRSGSAFAAEIGTMKVNEEIDALTTMGLDPVRFLAVNRVLATIFVTPLLTIFSNLCGLIGGAIVMLTIGYPLVTYISQVSSAVDYVDLLSGLAKSVVFGFLVASIGCLRGLQTKQGASAVGESTTTAVVSGIILIIVTDGIFSVVYYALGI